jgi:phosphate transport system protein
MRKEYIEVKRKIAEMSELAREMVDSSIKALIDGDIALAEKIIEKDTIMDRLDVETDELCFKILALYEPKAIDLRYIITAFRILSDLERVGDHCTNICEEVILLSQMPRVKPYIDIPRMAEYAGGMIVDAVEAYFNRDTALARDVIARDDFVDDLNGQVIRELITYLAEDIKKTKAALSLIFISNNLERIADHATNIAELVHFMVSGKIVRHGSWEGEDE